MYGNDYSIPLPAVIGWLMIAALGGCGFAFVRSAVARRRLLVAWAWLPSFMFCAFCAYLYVVIAGDRYMSPHGHHWLVMIGVGFALSLIVTPIWALAAIVSFKAVRRRWEADSTPS